MRREITATEMAIIKRTFKNAEALDLRRNTVLGKLVELQKKHDDLQSQINCFDDCVIRLTKGVSMFDIVRAGDNNRLELARNVTFDEKKRVFVYDDGVEDDTDGEPTLDDPEDDTMTFESID